MAWTFQIHRGSANNKTSGTTISVSPSGTMVVDRIAIVRCVSDNPDDASSGNTNFHSVSDSKGNTWTKIREETINPAGAAGSGATVSTFISKITTEILTTDNVTLTITIATTAKAIGIDEWSLAAGKTFSIVGINGAGGAGTTPSVALSGLPSTVYLFLGSVGVEGPIGDGFTQDADYGSTSDFGTTGGAAVTNVTDRLGRRIATLTGDTYNPTLGTSRDWAATLSALQEVDPPGEGLPPKSRFNVEKLRRPSPKGTIYV